MDAVKKARKQLNEAEAVLRAHEEQEKTRKDDERRATAEAEEEKRVARAMELISMECEKLEMFYRVLYRLNGDERYLYVSNFFASQRMRGEEVKP